MLGSIYTSIDRLIRRTLLNMYTVLASGLQIPGPLATIILHWNPNNPFYCYDHIIAIILIRSISYEHHHRSSSRPRTSTCKHIIKWIHIHGLKNFLLCTPSASKMIQKGTGNPRSDGVWSMTVQGCSKYPPLRTYYTLRLRVSYQICISYDSLGSYRLLRKNFRTCFY